MGVLHGWRWCPRCGSELAGAEHAVECRACSFVAWANPAPTANALVVDDSGRLLLGRRAHPPEAGKWDILGGFVHEGEDALDALRRELREETGLEVEPTRFVGTWSSWYGDGPDAAGTLNLFWEARAAGGNARPSDDVTELRWFAAAELPTGDDVAFRGLYERVFAAWRQTEA